MKTKSTLIVLLYLFFHGGIKAQNSKSLTENSNQKQNIVKPVKTISPVDSIQLKKHVKESSFVTEPKKQAETSNQILQTKVKNKSKSTPLKEDSNSGLNELSNAYWRTQTEIKEAKSQNDLILLEELEINSLTHRSGYITVFESLDASDVSVEQVKLYHSFKKDFDNE